MGVQGYADANLGLLQANCGRKEGERGGGDPTFPSHKTERKRRNRHLNKSAEPKPARLRGQVQKQTEEEAAGEVTGGREIEMTTWRALNAGEKSGGLHSPSAPRRSPVDRDPSRRASLTPSSQVSLNGPKRVGNPSWPTQPDKLGLHTWV